MTELLFRDDAYLTTCEAHVRGITEEGYIISERSVFYGASGGQPGDIGFMELEDGSQIKLIEARMDRDKLTILHVPEEPVEPSLIDQKVVLHIDWARRYKFMRMHTALHLLSVVLPFPVTGGQIGEMKSRLDFDMPDAPGDKEELNTKINQLVADDYHITQEWITDAELEAQPDLVKTMSVKPPMEQGKIRLVRIGDDIDLQPCGGTHVLSTKEIGPLEIGKIEKKGKQNRRVSLHLLDN